MIDSSKLVNWYDFQAPFYSLWRDRYDSPLVRRVAEFFDPAGEAARVLDAGCGTGWYAVGLARLRPGWTVVGLDASAGMLAVARRQARSNRAQRVALSRGDVQALPFPGTGFDAAVAAGLFPNLNDPAPALRELHRVLRPGGRLAVVEFDREAMSAFARFTFRTMILGYRIVSAVFRRFRFARQWDLAASTIDRARLEEQLRAAGFRAVEVRGEAGHLVFLSEKG
jgi:demethylmenaquinone methyltransferase/2-methoxy-6-polyprenyl-1,4-benzoquinol methylase